TLPIRTLLFIEFFNYRPRVLDAWVVAHIDSAKEGFGKKKTVSDRFVHVPIPVILDNNNLAHLTGKDVQPTFDKKRATLLLWGEGGVSCCSLISGQTYPSFPVCPAINRSTYSLSRFCQLGTAFNLSLIPGFTLKHT
ncbi:hypothetical protein, partial [Staphylococcus aureus]|uniref:hypothetical protein n=1 Tax=Staphylococcus aureus TaxID=1280 RepID=UPI0019D646DC